MAVKKDRNKLFLSLVIYPRQIYRAARGFLTASLCACLGLCEAPRQGTERATGTDE